MAPDWMSDLAEQIGVHGLRLRGGFHPKRDEVARADGSPTGTVVLIGNAGSEM